LKKSGLQKGRHLCPGKRGGSEESGRKHSERHVDFVTTCRGELVLMTQYKRKQLEKNERRFAKRKGAGRRNDQKRG